MKYIKIYGTNSDTQYTTIPAPSGTSSSDLIEIATTDWVNNAAEHNYLYKEADSNGLTYAVCPTPKDASGNIATYDYSNKIATTEWVTSKYKISSAAPSGGNDGDVWFQYV